MMGYKQGTIFLGQSVLIIKCIFFFFRLVSTFVCLFSANIWESLACLYLTKHLVIKQSHGNHNSNDAQHERTLCKNQ